MTNALVILGIVVWFAFFWKVYRINTAPFRYHELMRYPQKSPGVPDHTRAALHAVARLARHQSFLMQSNTLRS